MRNKIKKLQSLPATISSHEVQPWSFCEFADTPGKWITSNSIRESEHVPFRPANPYFLLSKSGVWFYSHKRILLTAKDRQPWELTSNLCPLQESYCLVQKEMGLENHTVKEMRCAWLLTLSGLFLGPWALKPTPSPSIWRKPVLLLAWGWNFLLFFLGASLDS